MPSGMRLGPAPKISRDHGSEVFHPATDRLVGDHDPTFGQQVLDIAEAEGEPGIEPDGLLDDYRWEAISGVTDLCHDRGLRPHLAADKPNNVTMPPCQHTQLHMRPVMGQRRSSITPPRACSPEGAATNTDAQA